MLMESIISYESNLMLAAILCLLLVILFVLLLHIYARWFLAEAQQRQTRATLSVARVLSQVRLGQEHPTTYAYDITSRPSIQTTKGLNITEIDSIPLFVYGSDGREPALECAICLSVFEGREVGRSLPRCSHAFHVECIDMWLHSHSTCPICRAHVPDIEVDETTEKAGVGVGVGGDMRIDREADSRSLAEILVQINEDNSSDESESVNSVRFRLDCSLGRILSRSRSENRVYPSFVATQLEVV